MMTSNRGERMEHGKEQMEDHSYAGWRQRQNASSARSTSAVAASPCSLPTIGFRIWSPGPSAKARLMRRTTAMGRMLKMGVLAGILGPTSRMAEVPVLFVE